MDEKGTFGWLGCQQRQMGSLETMEINVEILAPIIDQLGSSAGNICMHVD